MFKLSFTKDEAHALLSGLEMLFEEYDPSHCHPDMKKMLKAAESIQARILESVNPSDLRNELQ